VRNLYRRSRIPNTRVMIGSRIAAILLLSSLATAQDVSSPEIGRSNTPKPKIPVVDYNACPGKDKTIPNVKVDRVARAYASWRRDSKPIGVLRVGEEVTIIGGVNVVYEPDIAVVKYAHRSPEYSSLTVGGVAFGYGIEADATVVFWSNGTWFGENFESVGEKGSCGYTSGFGQGGCTVDITKHGVSEWWAQVRTAKGVSGWVLAAKFNGDKRGYVNFSNLCGYSED
jgi:hypothetical protein